MSMYLIIADFADVPPGFRYSLHETLLDSWISLSFEVLVQELAARHREFLLHDQVFPSFAGVAYAALFFPTCNGFHQSYKEN